MLSQLKRYKLVLLGRNWRNILKFHGRTTRKILKLKHSTAEHTAF